MAMKKKILLISISLILAIIIAVGIYLIVLFTKKSDPIPVDEDNLQIFLDEHYFGNTAYGEGNTKVTSFDVKAALGYKTEDVITVTSKDTDIATVDNNIITILKTGELDLTIMNNGVESKKEITVIEGVNVFDFEDFFYAINEKSVIVLQKDIELDNPADYAFGSGVTDNFFGINANIYGNAHKVVCEKFLDEDHSVAFRVKSNDVTIRDTYFIGTVKVEDLTTLRGFLIAIDGENDKPMTGIKFENCIAENSQRLVTVATADVTVKGCIMRNSGDSCINIQTTPNGTSHVIVENTVMGNAIVAAIVIWGWDAITDPNDYVNLQFKGFWDVYNWKETDNINLIPPTEQFASLNSLIQDEVNKDENDAFLYHYNDNKYLAPAIIVISTAKTKSFPVITGYEEAGYVKRQFPLPFAASGILKTCDAYTYNYDTLTIKPDSKMSDNPNLYRELKEGRDD